MSRTPAHSVISERRSSGITTLVAAIVFAVRTAAPLNVLWRIPIVFFVIHVCWGAGFWLGLFEANRRL